MIDSFIMYLKPGYVSNILAVVVLKY